MSWREEKTHPTVTAAVVSFKSSFNSEYLHFINHVQPELTTQSGTAQEKVEKGRERL